MIDFEKIKKEVKKELTPKQIFTPGEIVCEEKNAIPGQNTFFKNEKIYANKLGILDKKNNYVNIIPLNGTYIPSVGQTIIGTVMDVFAKGWFVDIHSTQKALIGVGEATTKYVKKGELESLYNTEDLVVGKILNIANNGNIDLTTIGRDLGKIHDGRIIKIKSHRIPRIIGKNNSMIKIITEKTNTQIIPGMNGIIWIKGEPINEIIAIEAIKTIEENSYMNGLTNYIEEFLDLCQKEILNKNSGTQNDL